MKKVLIIFLLSVTAFHAHAQNSKTITAVNIQANNSYQFSSSKSAVNSFYALGGQATVFFKDKIYLGVSQLNSLAPSDLLKKSELVPNKVKMFDYALNAGVKSGLGKDVYLLTGIRGGIGIVKLGTDQKVDGINEFISKEKRQHYFVAPEVKVGFQIHKNFAIEAGATYKKNFGGSEKWGVSAKDFNGFGATLSLVGSIPIK
jgi:hypothetical protein